MRYFFASKFLSNMKVLDVGSGTGYGSEFVSRKNHLVVGIDKDISAIKIAKMYRGQNVSFIQGDARKLPFRNDTFDAVICFEVIEHLDEPLKLLEEIRRVLKPGGLVICSTPNKRYSAHPIYHKHEFEKTEFINAIDKFFKIESIYIQKLSIFLYLKNLSRGYLIRFISSIFQELPSPAKELIRKTLKRIRPSKKTKNENNELNVVTPRVVDEKLISLCKNYGVIPENKKRLTDLSYIFIIRARKG